MTDKLEKEPENNQQQDNSSNWNKDFDWVAEVSKNSNGTSQSSDQTRLNSKDNSNASCILDNGFHIGGLPGEKSADQGMAKGIGKDPGDPGSAKGAGKEPVEPGSGKATKVPADSEKSKASEENIPSGINREHHQNVLTQKERELIESRQPKIDDNSKPAAQPETTNFARVGKPGDRDDLSPKEAGEPADQKDNPEESLNKSIESKDQPEIQKHFNSDHTTVIQRDKDGQTVTLRNGDGKPLTVTRYNNDGTRSEDVYRLDSKGDPIKSSTLKWDENKKLTFESQLSPDGIKLTERHYQPKDQTTGKDGAPVRDKYTQKEYRIDEKSQKPVLEKESFVSGNFSIVTKYDAEGKNPISKTLTDTQGNVRRELSLDSKSAKTTPVDEQKQTEKKFAEELSKLGIQIANKNKNADSQLDKHPGSPKDYPYDLLQPVPSIIGSLDAKKK
ncbi:MAG: hypothetical protein K2X77_01100 [Candidatus Obscuribacterales bacterium]|jgi:hypothetical protein|nr:hypothetical protein [Candidatus Obscuribacterales bacterium]